MKTQLTDLQTAEKAFRANPPWAGNELVARVFGALEGEALVVGGAVRDALLYAPVADFDIATPFTPDEVVARVEHAGLKAHPTGIEHGTVTVSLGKGAVEVTSLRSDVETDGRRATVAFTSSVRKDAGRRDFTINALYADLEGTVYDFFGGLDDLKAKRVRFIGDAEARIAEDYLRILRFFRFSARFSPQKLDEEGLWASMRAREKLQTLSRERVRAEFLKTLILPSPEHTLHEMFSHGFLATIIPLAPHLTRFANLRKREAQLGEEPDAMRGLGALYLLKDEDVKTLERFFVLSRAEKAALYGLLPKIDYSGQPLRAAIYGYGKEAVKNQILSAHHLPLEKARKALEITSNWQAPTFPLTGADMAAKGIKPGPEMGARLKALEARWIESDFSLSREALLSQV